MLSCCGQSMLRYRTDLLRLLETLLFLPAFLTGAAEYKQMLEVELFSDYTDDPVSPSLLCQCASQAVIDLRFCFFPCAVCPLGYCHHWDPVQQRADLLISALHSCSFDRFKVRVTTASSLRNLLCIFEVWLYGLLVNGRCISYRRLVKSWQTTLNWQFITTLSSTHLIYRGFIFVGMTAISVSPFARYLLFNFPLLSALVGVSSNFVFLSVVFILSYLRLLLTVYWAPVQVRGDTNHCRYTF